MANSCPVQQRATGSAGSVSRTRFISGFRLRGGLFRMAFRFGYHKYKAKRTDGFPSKLEAAVYGKLLEREKFGLIKNIKRQQVVTLINCDHCGTRMTWKVDFSFEENGRTVFCEAKGIETDDYKRKVKQWRESPPARLEIWKGIYKNPKLIEVIERKV
jgi:hypothetical protein